MVDLAEQAKALADGIEAALPGWVERSVDRIYRAWAGPAPAEVTRSATEAGAAAAAEIGPRVRALLEADIDDQSTTPLSIARGAVRYPTAVLRAAGVPPVRRDRVDEDLFPEDDYGLTPARLADIDAGLVEVGLEWGAAKAWVHRRRHGGGT